MPVPGKLHVGADGKLTGPARIRYNDPFPTGNGNPGLGASTMLGVVMHTEQGSEASCVATFNNPASEASAFFAVAFDGTIWQFGPVGQNWMAWAQAGGNPDWYSIEHEGFVGEPLTEAQVIADAQLLECLSAFASFPLQVSDDVNTKGYGWHGMGGVPWGNHPLCPGDKRKAQRPAILDLASQIRAGAPAPGPWEDYVTPGGVSLRVIAHAGGTWVPTVLERTEQAFGSQHDMFAYIGAGNWDAPMPAGIRLRVPAGTHVTPKHRRRPVRKAARAVAGTAAAGISGTRSFTRTEPVLTSGSVLAVLAAVLGWAMPHLGVHWDHAVNSSVLTGLTALAGLWAALRVTRPSVAGVTAALQALATAAATFGLHLPAVNAAMATPVAALLVSLLLRGHVSPKGAPQPAPVSLAEMTAPLMAEIDAFIALARQVAGGVGIGHPGAQTVAAPPPPAPAPDTAPPAVPAPGEVRASA